MTGIFDSNQSQGVCMLSLKGVVSRMWNITHLDLEINGLVFVSNFHILVHADAFNMHAIKVLMWMF